MVSDTEKVTSVQGLSARRINRRSLNAITFGIIVASLYAFATLMVEPRYIYGDPSHYRLFYNGVVGMTLSHGYEFYHSSLGASEPGYYLIVRLFAPIMSRLQFEMVCNGIFGYLIARILVKLKISWLIIFLFIFNFYILVLLLSADRLKISMIFVALAVNARTKIRGSLLLTAALCHFQSLLLIACYLAHELYLPMARAIFLGKLHVRLLLGGLFAACIAVFALKYAPYIMAKIAVYSLTYTGLLQIVEPLIFLLVSLWYGKGGRKRIFVSYMPLVLAAYFVGDIRVTIFAYLLFVIFGFRVRGGLNVGVVMTTGYFAVTGIMFLATILKYGNGFPS